MKIYHDGATHIAGITLKNEQKLEDNNMAFHVCEDEANVVTNRLALANTLQVPLNRFFCANQTHSAHFYEVREEDAGRGSHTMETAITDTDALYTYEPNIVLCSFTADCVPVLFYHERTGLIGAIHSGWQGTIKEITEKTLHHLIEEGNEAEHFRVYIGMALSQEKFEVDADVYEKFQALGYADDFMYYKRETNKYHIDNQLTVQKQCERVGIPVENITLDRDCTFIDKAGFSYRENKGAGRHVSYIMRK